MSALFLAVPASATAAAPRHPGRGGASPAVPSDLRVDYLRDPLGIDDTTPSLSWQLPDHGAAATQQAYEIRATSTGGDPGTAHAWDSGKVDSPASIDVAWNGPQLTSREQVNWQVRTWGADGQVTGWSAPAQFEMALLHPSDWSAKWISNPKWLDREPTPVTLNVPAQDARYIHITTTKLGLPLQEGSHLYYRLQLAEVVVQNSADPATDLARDAGVTSTDPQIYKNSWEPRFLTDGLLTSNQKPCGYSSSAHTSAALDEPVTLTIDLGTTKHFDQILLYGRTDTTTDDGRTPNFPSDYTVATSPDGSAYSNVADVHDQKAPPAYNLDYPALPLFAKQFTIDKPIRSARLYATGLGIYDARVNGDPISKAVLQPGNTDYHDRVTYSTDDVTPLLQRGANSLSLRLGTGTEVVPDFPDRYTKWSGVLGPPELLAQLEITYADGSTQRIVSDDSWRTTSGPTTFSQWYGGEDYDARRVQAGWDQPGADLTGWQQAPVTTPPTPTTKLTAQMDPPIEPVQTLHTAAITEPDPGTYVFDLGTNIAGWPVLHVSGPAGTTVTLKPGERLGPDGLVDQSTMIKGGATYPPIVDHYTLAGNGTETWHPDFVYHGFRYLQVTGLPDGAGKDMVDAIVLRAANRQSGSFDSSSELLNSVHSLINRSVQGNMYSILTDCPDREKLGWLEQDHLEFDTVARNYDVAAYYREQIRNMAEAQEANGMVPAIAPLVYNVFGGNPDQVGEPNWGSALIMSGWQVYRTYGDVDTLRTYYPNMQRYLEYLQGRTRGDLLDYGLGDWGAVDKSTPTGITATYALYRDAATMADIARVLGNDSDAKTYADYAQKVADAYNAEYLNEANGTYGNGTQADDALSLDMGIVPAADRAAVLDHLVAGIRAAGNHLTVGEIALPAVFRVLSAAHRDDVLYDVAERTDNPSYGYSVVHGATALPEYWDGATGYGSQDHFMMGAIENWFSSALGGISQADDSVGYRHLLIAPRVVGDLTSAGSSYDTPYGRAVSSWWITGSRFHLAVTVPGNTSATVQVPLWAGQGGATATAGAQLIGRTADTAEYRLGPGRWEFGSKLPAPVHPDAVQLAVNGPQASVPVVSGQATTATFSVYNLMDHDVTVRPSATISDGFAATAPDSLTLPAHESTDLSVQVKRTSSTATSGTLSVEVGGHSAKVAVEGTDDLARIATMSASSTHSKWDPARTNNGETVAQTDYDVWNSGAGWNDGTSKKWPDTLTATWSQRQTIGHVRVLTVDQPGKGAELYGLRDYDVQALENRAWVTVASVRGNVDGTVDSTFDPVTTTAMRLSITDSNDHTYSRVVEFEAYAS